MFRINLHSHVKIWFNLTENNHHQFINYENYFRLIKTRRINPNDVIHFIYSEKLLSDKAKKNLLIFCTKYKIIPHSLETDIYHALESDNEKKLFSLVLMEIEAARLRRGGNLAAASDMLRWLFPVLKLGCYSDLDVYVDTNQLEDKKEVNVPMLSCYAYEEMAEGIYAINSNNDIMIFPEVNPELTQEEHG